MDEREVAEARLEAVLEIATSMPAAADGTLSRQARAHIQTILATPVQQQAALALEVAYGSEPPASGFRYEGDGRWVREKERVFSIAEENPRIAVVGGGPAGLFTIYLLNQRCPQAHITLFESASRLGGKVLTERFPDGTPFEAGVAELYEYLGPDAKDPLRSLIENDLNLTTVNMSGGGVVLRGHVLRDHDDLERVFGKKTRENVERFHKKMTDLMPLERYASRWQPDNKHPWADKTFYDCIRAELKDDDAAVEYVEAACASDLATESWTCNGLNGIKNVLLDNEQYMQLYHVLGGIERLPEALRGRLCADVKLETKVLSIEGKSSEERGRTYLLKTISAGRESLEEFDYVVLAMPNHWLSQLHYADASLSEALHGVMAHYDLPAHYFRVTLLFRSPWWQRYNLPGDFFMMDMLNGCCVYDEAKRWRGDHQGFVLSFLLCGQDALLMCAFNGDKDAIVRHLLVQLPADWRTQAESELLDSRIDSYAGSINAQPGGWPAEELRGEHQPDAKNNPGVLIVGDYLFDSTLNAALISASTAVELLLEEAGIEPLLGTEAVESLVSRGKELSLVRG